MTRTRVANLVGIGIGVAGVAFVVQRIIRDRAEIGDALSAAAPVWLVVGAVTGSVAMTLIGVNWLGIIRHGGGTVRWRRGLSWFFVGQLGKYVPGGIWPIVGQAELAHRGATPRPVAYASTAMSMVATFLGAAVVGAVTGLVAPTSSRWVPALLAAGVGVVAVLVVAPPARRSADRIAHRLTRRELRLPEAQWFAVIVTRHLPVWLAFAGMNVFSVVALGVDLDTRLVVQLVFVTCVSWMAGFVVVGVPGGIGVRETIFISMMTAPLGAGVAVAAAVLSRVVSIVVDLAGAGVSMAFARLDDSPSTPAVDGYAAP